MRCWPCWSRCRRATARFVPMSTACAACCAPVPMPRPPGPTRRCAACMTRSASFRNEIVSELPDSAADAGAAESPAMLPVPASDAVIRAPKVHGQSMEKLPEDLYIPPDALEVFLEAFEGPLDLLLYLIRRQNLNILDIPVLKI